MSDTPPDPVPVTEEQYKQAIADQRAAETIINQYHRQKYDAFESWLASGAPFTDAELVYSMYMLCPCGYGLPERLPPEPLLGLLGNPKGDRQSPSEAYRSAALRVLRCESGGRRPDFQQDHARRFSSGAKSSRSIEHLPMATSSYPLRPRLARAWTRRRIAAASRVVVRDAADMALFPALRRYGTVEDRMREVDAESAAWVASMRQFVARSWRKARRQLRELPEISARGIKRYFISYGGPQSPTYLLDMITQVRRGESAWTWLRVRRQLVLKGADRRAAAVSFSPSPANAS